MLRGYSSESAFRGVSFDNIMLSDHRVASSLEDLRLNANGHVDDLQIIGEPISAPDASSKFVGDACNDRMTSCRIR